MPTKENYTEGVRLNSIIEKCKSDLIKLAYKEGATTIDNYWPDNNDIRYAQAFKYLVTDNFKKYS